MGLESLINSNFYSGALGDQRLATTSGSDKPTQNYQTTSDRSTVASGSLASNSGPRPGSAEYWAAKLENLAKAQNSTPEQLESQAVTYIKSLRSAASVNKFCESLEASSVKKIQTLVASPAFKSEVLAHLVQLNPSPSATASNSMPTNNKAASTLADNLKNIFSSSKQREALLKWASTNQENADKAAKLVKVLQSTNNVGTQDARKKIAAVFKATTTGESSVNNPQVSRLLGEWLASKNIAENADSYLNTHIELFKTMDNVRVPTSADSKGTIDSKIKALRTADLISGPTASNMAKLIKDYKSNEENKLKNTAAAILAGSGLVGVGFTAANIVGNNKQTQPFNQIQDSNKLFAMYGRGPEFFRSESYSNWLASVPNELKNNPKYFSKADGIPLSGLLTEGGPDAEAKAKAVKSLQLAEQNFTQFMKSSSSQMPGNIKPFESSSVYNNMVNQAKKENPNFVTNKSNGESTFSSLYYADPKRSASLNQAANTYFLSEGAKNAYVETIFAAEMGKDNRGLVHQIEDARRGASFASNTDSANTTTSFYTQMLQLNSIRDSKAMSNAKAASDNFTTGTAGKAKAAESMYIALTPGEQKSLPTNKEFETIEKKIVSLSQLATSGTPEQIKKNGNLLIAAHSDLGALYAKKVNVFTAAIDNRTKSGLTNTADLQKALEITVTQQRENARNQKTAIDTVNAAIATNKGTLPDGTQTNQAAIADKNLRLQGLNTQLNRLSTELNSLNSKLSSATSSRNAQEGLVRGQIPNLPKFNLTAGLTVVVTDGKPDGFKLSDEKAKAIVDLVRDGAIERAQFANLVDFDTGKPKTIPMAAGTPSAKNIQDLQNKIDANNKDADKIREEINKLTQPTAPARPTSPKSDNPAGNPSATIATVPTEVTNPYNPSVASVPNTTQPTAPNATKSESGSNKLQGGWVQRPDPVETPTLGQVRPGGERSGGPGGFGDGKQPVIERTGPVGGPKKKDPVDPKGQVLTNPLPTPERVKPESFPDKDKERKILFPNGNIFTTPWSPDLESDEGAPSPKPQTEPATAAVAGNPLATKLNNLPKAQQVKVLEQWALELNQNKPTASASALKEMIGTQAGLSKIVQQGLGGTVAQALSGDRASALFKRYDSVNLLRSLAKQTEVKDPALAKQAQALATKLDGLISQRSNVFTFNPTLRVGKDPVRISEWSTPNSTPRVASPAGGSINATNSSPSVNRTNAPPEKQGNQSLSDLKNTLAGMKKELDKIAEQGKPTAQQAERILKRMKAAKNEFFLTAAQKIKELPSQLQGAATNQLNEAQKAWDEWSPGALKNLDEFASNAGKALAILGALMWAIPGAVVDSALQRA